ncbi:exopolysaccharide biosynthesis polyprenyl glycosylphosphotransferase [Aurantibacter crassamenti]|uniref:exopolysaccharide biosynthesis polyprenyl glycosylphosphotransferase n=1 Tax=Aurantibacter crassamenti TaxID=1837375 RepID=UPI00193A393D|nr:exopolysaccharide biosynthesis polyprenyl glycosylphosphotransferase [Aurantibacter crassamenti]MBM1105823.1 exopolysaccharide biosynthesis polyprenyl glycosylphosphotransferase [Aurantibacter crassamenti]
MKQYKNSDFIIPISVVIHLCIINGILAYLTPDTYFNVYHILYYNLSWIFIINGVKYYPIGRKDRFTTKLNSMLQLYLVYGLAYFALFAFIGKIEDSVQYHLLVYALICLALLTYRALFFWLMSTYRTGGGNSAKLVVIGGNGNLEKVKKVFDEPDLGYRFLGFFSDKQSNNENYLGKVENCFLYILENDIDEIYCEASEFNALELKNLIGFADNNLIKFKVLLDNKEMFSRAMSIELYDNIPVLNLRNVPLDTEYARITKRTFDLFFSSLVIITILSWLSPLLYILIRFESKGSLYFKQKRHGFKRRVFWCYKFRSMVCNQSSDTQMAIKNDLRVTRIGNFLRKTSIDELPQFFNVFLGDMSVVGPRPHMELHTDHYENSVDKYLVRHFVKPGITGLAQTRGYRGEIENNHDIESRVRLDIFYVEKWSLWLDLAIIFNTIANFFKKEEKAY